MKYSEFIYQVMENLTPRDYWICHVLKYNKIAKQHPEHAEKLRRTVEQKLRKVNPVNTSFAKTLFRLELKYNLPPLETRIKWLKTIAKIHARKGN